jgi:hypothetical protein
VIAEIDSSARSFGVSSYPAGITVSNRALIMLSDVLRHRRTQLRTRWWRLEAGQQALLVVAYSPKGETYLDLAWGSGSGTTTVFCYIREALDVLAAMARPCRTGSRPPDVRRS